MSSPPRKTRSPRVRIPKPSATPAGTAGSLPPIGRQLADTLGATRRIYALVTEPVPVTNGPGVPRRPRPRLPEGRAGVDPGRRDLPPRPRPRPGSAPPPRPTHGGAYPLAASYPPPHH